MTSVRGMRLRLMWTRKTRSKVLKSNNLSKKTRNFKMSDLLVFIREPYRAKITKSIENRA